MRSGAGVRSGAGRAARFFVWGGRVGTARHDDVGVLSPSVSPPSPHLDVPAAAAAAEAAAERAACSSRTRFGARRAFRRGAAGAAVATGAATASSRGAGRGWPGLRARSTAPYMPSSRSRSRFPLFPLRSPLVSLPAAPLLSPPLPPSASSRSLRLPLTESIHAGTSTPLLLSTAASPLRRPASPSPNRVMASPPLPARPVRPTR